MSVSTAAAAAALLPERGAAAVVVAGRCHGGRREQLPGWLPRCQLIPGRAQRLVVTLKGRGRQRSSRRQQHALVAVSCHSHEDVAAEPSVSLGGSGDGNHGDNHSSSPATTTPAAAGASWDGMSKQQKEAEVIKAFITQVEMIVDLIVGLPFVAVAARVLLRLKALFNLVMNAVGTPALVPAVAEFLLVLCVGLLVPLIGIDGARDLKVGRAALEKTRIDQLKAGARLRMRWSQVKMVLTVIGAYLLVSPHTIAIGAALVFIAQALFDTLTPVTIDDRARVRPWILQERLLLTGMNGLGVALVTVMRYTGSTKVALVASVLLALAVLPYVTERLLPGLFPFIPSPN